MHRALFRTLEIFDYRTFLVAGGFVLLLLVGYLIVGAVQGAHDANTTANLRGQAASRRIDGLQTTITDQAETIAGLRAAVSAAVARQNALARQVEQLGGRPVVQPSPERIYVVISPSPAASPSRSPRPFPSASPSRTPRPSPSPTCRPVPVIGCRSHAR